MQPYRQGFDFEDMVADGIVGLLLLIVLVIAAVAVTIAIIVATELGRAIQEGIAAGGETARRIQLSLALFAGVTLVGVGLLVAGVNAGLVLLCWAFAALVIAVEFVSGTSTAEEQELSLADVLQPWPARPHQDGSREPTREGSNLAGVA